MRVHDAVRADPAAVLGVHVLLPGRQRGGVHPVPEDHRRGGVVGDPDHVYPVVPAGRVQGRHLGPQHIVHPDLERVRHAGRRLGRDVRQVRLAQREPLVGGGSVAAAEHFVRDGLAVRGEDDVARDPDRFAVQGGGQVIYQRHRGVGHAGDLVWLDRLHAGRGTGDQHRLPGGEQRRRGQVELLPGYGSADWPVRQGQQAGSGVHGGLPPVERSQAGTSVQRDIAALGADGVLRLARGNRLGDSVQLRVGAGLAEHEQGVGRDLRIYRIQVNRPAGHGLRRIQAEERPLVGVDKLGRRADLGNVPLRKVYGSGRQSGAL